MPLDYTHQPITVAGKTAVVVGGTSGIGRAIALGFAAEGADVVPTSRTPEKVERTAAEIRERGVETVEATCDVTDRASLERLRDDVIDSLGHVDVLVNSSSSIARSSVSAVTEDEWEGVLDVQLDGPVRATQVFAKRMDEGAVVNISSASSVSALPDLAAYTTAKGGIDAFTRAAAAELGPEIRVNAIRPGFVRTEQTKGTYSEGDHRYEVIKSRTTNGRLAEPAEITGAAVYLASDAASYTTGEILTVDDGFLSATFEE
ncbi:SDR family NAD(P)-dependent oxidoreductase [Haloarcula nitratireducens]|uniref:SDR family oxidoreductase n=1 Tax=Haloarcula nitratireducens TaxID=2487749 RepID=A0AAW4PIK1_9EURY|nr:SDR family oxidoreductase [Halomicroarcula nitratireducens]MBX0297042.1 SDR family oxidoreductase [Halomicroarcula nitratireducens]